MIYEETLSIINNRQSAAKHYAAPNPGSSFVCFNKINSPMWWNWQITIRLGRIGQSPCRFESCHRHQKLFIELYFLFIGKPRNTHFYLFTPGARKLHKARGGRSLKVQRLSKTFLQIPLAFIEVVSRVGLKRDPKWGASEQVELKMKIQSCLQANPKDDINLSNSLIRYLPSRGLGENNETWCGNDESIYHHELYDSINVSFYVCPWDYQFHGIYFKCL